jgi:hypothetical protein
MKILKILFIIFWIIVGLRAIAMYDNLGEDFYETLGALIGFAIIWGLPIFFVGRSLSNEANTNFEEE